MYINIYTYIQHASDVWLISGLIITVATGNLPTNLPPIGSISGEICTSTSEDPPAATAMPQPQASPQKAQQPFVMVSHGQASIPCRLV